MISHVLRRRTACRAGGPPVAQEDRLLDDLLLGGGGAIRIGAVETLSQQILLHLKQSRRLVVKPEEVYYLEAAGNDTIVRRRGRQTLRDVRSLGEMMAVMERLRFHRIHDRFAVNLHRVREIRLQRDGEDWEVVLRSPVHRVLPVSRRRLRSLWRRFGE